MAFLAQVLDDHVPCWGSGGEVSLPCCDPACCCSLAGDMSLLSKKTWGAGIGVEYQFCINFSIQSLAEKEPVLC